LKDHWKEYQHRWHLLEAPLRPNAEVVEAIVAAVGERLSNVLLLGVTPELVDAFPNLTAVDKSEEMIAALWQSQATTQSVRHANWLDMDAAYGRYSAIVGDCSINVLQSYAQIETLLPIVNERLADDGVFACRVFERPAEPITEKDLRCVIDDGTHGNFHAYKWQIAMSLAADSSGAVQAVEILDRFNQLFPQRVELARKTGWNIDVINTIDVYENSGIALLFPSRQEFDSLFTKHFDRYEWRSCGSYDLAQRCPIFVAERL